MIDSIETTRKDSCGSGGESLANTLEKQFNELANSEIKDLVKMTPLNRRYDKWFKQIQSIPNYKVTVTEQNLL